MLLVITVALVTLAALNAILMAWATVLDARHASALMRVLGANSRQVSSGLAAAQVLSALPGAILGKGHRYYDWALISIGPASPGHRWLLIRRNHRTREPAFYRCYAPRHVPLATLVKAAGRRWTTEENFQAAKGLAGLDEHQVRHWTSWYRWTTLAMLACAFLTITAAAEHTRAPAPRGLAPLTRNEISRLFAALIIQPVRDSWHRLRWSAWRRRHQHRAQACHYRLQARNL